MITRDDALLEALIAHGVAADTCAEIGHIGDEDEWSEAVDRAYDAGNWSQQAQDQLAALDTGGNE